MPEATETFRQHGILLTGANGFLGKVVLGFLLDRFPDFRHLYVLIRPKANQSAEQRFQSEVVQSPALAAIVAKRGEEFLSQKITVLSGDVAQTECGIDPARLEQLRGRIALVINCAGLVEFFPPIVDSFASNVDGVEHVVSLCKELGARLLHVSTCYVCGEHEGIVEETEPILGFYPHRKGPEDTSFDYRQELSYCRKRIQQIEDSATANGEQERSKAVLRRLTALGKERAEFWGWVNTYTFGKSIAEQIIASEENLQYAIVRPAIVESSLEFPFPGWVEGGRTAAPLVLMAMGGLRHWTVRGDLPLEVVPVDLVASAILTISVLLLNGQSAPVYQLGTADTNPILLEPLVKLLHAEYAKSRSNNRVRQPVLTTRVRIVSAEAARLRRIRLQKRTHQAQVLLVGLRKLLDSAGLPGRRSLASWSVALRTLGLQASVREQTLALYQPFILDNRFIFESENIRAAHRLLSPKDRELLPWNPERIDWEGYWINHQIKGVQQWVQPKAMRDRVFHA